MNAISHISTQLYTPLSSLQINKLIVERQEERVRLYNTRSVYEWTNIRADKH